MATNLDNKWKTKDGRIIRLQDISEAHLINIYRKYTRNSWKLPSKILVELDRRGLSHLRKKGTSRNRIAYLEQEVQSLKDEVQVLKKMLGDQKWKLI